MNDWIPKLWNFARGAWRELPLEALAVAVAAITAISVVHEVSPGDVGQAWQARLILASLLLAPLFFAATLLERQRLISRRIKLASGGILAVATLAALALGAPTADHMQSDGFAWTYGLTLLAAVLVPFVTIALSAGREERLPRFTWFVRIFFEQTTTWSLLWLGALAAIGVIAAALHGLFDLSIDKLLADGLLVMTAGLVLSYLYSLLPRSKSDAARARLPELWRRLVTTIGAPFVCVMLIILVVYEAFVLISGELPRNMLSPLIMAAGFVGFLCTLIIVSILRQDTGNNVLAPADPHRWSKSRSIRLVRMFPMVLLILLPMAGWALAVRIEQYGFTPFRVARLMALGCLGILSVLGTWRWLRGRMALTWEVPVCVIAVALVTAFGPLSATNLSIRSQTDRLERQLTEAGITEREVSPIERPIIHHLDYDTYWELGELIDLLAELGGEEAVGRVLNGDLSICADRWSGRPCLERLGVGYQESARASTYDPIDFQGTFVTDQSQLEFISLTDYRGYRSGSFELTLTSRSVKLFDGEHWKAEARLDHLIAEWEQSRDPSPRVVDLRSEDGVVVGQIAIQKIRLVRLPERETTIDELSGAWLRPSQP